MPLLEYFLVAGFLLFFSLKGKRCIKKRGKKIQDPKKETGGQKYHQEHQDIQVQPTKKKGPKEQKFTKEIS